MEKRKLTTKYCLALIVFMTFSQSSYGIRDRKIPQGCKWIEVDSDGASLSAVEKVIGKVDLNSWPQSNLLKASPKINKSLLSDSDLVTELGPYFNDYTRFAGNGWTECEWGWERRVAVSKPLPTDLPPERKARLLAKMSPEKRNDPDFVKEYFKRKLDRERSSKRYKFAVTGEVILRLCITPCSRAAQEYLVSYLPLRSNLPIDLIAASYSKSNRTENLGTIGFSKQSDRARGHALIMFVRDNIAVIIKARGELSKEALPLARKIDKLIQGQPALTYEELVSRRPAVTVAQNVDKSPTGEKTVSYNITAPAGQEIVDVQAYVDGENASVMDGKIHIVNKMGTVNVKVVAFTDELLTNTFEVEVLVPE